MLGYIVSDKEKTLGYIVSDKEQIKVNLHEIIRFDVLCKTNLNIFITIYDNFVFCKNNIINTASYYGFCGMLEWFKKSGNKLKYDKRAIINSSLFNFPFILKFFIENVNIKKIIKWIKNKYFYAKPLKFKTKNNYVKGYNKN